MIACLNVPYFAATVERRAGDQALAQPGQAPGLVLGGQPWEPQPVYAFSHEAAQQGVKSGMSLRLAHVLSPEAHFMAADPPRYYDASAEVAGVLLDFTHLIEIEALWAPHVFGLKKGEIQFGLGQGVSPQKNGAAGPRGLPRRRFYQALNRLRPRPGPAWRRPP